MFHVVHLVTLVIIRTQLIKNALWVVLADGLQITLPGLVSKNAQFTPLITLTYRAEPV